MHANGSAKANGQQTDTGTQTKERHMNAAKYKDSLIWLIEYLAAERDYDVPAADELATVDADRLWPLLRGLFNTRPAGPASAEFYRIQDALLSGMIADVGITDADDLPAFPGLPGISLGRGDITTLRADAIVNAANSGLQGCWQPNHLCIDNAIQTFAGVQMRQECARIMERQGHPEGTGLCKVTKGYNLPAAHVLHTVGPIANGRPTEAHCAQLASCYRSCLNAAAQLSCRTLAFCCISTGVFGFPINQATPIAVETVRAWLAAHPDQQLHVVFNVFSEADEAVYRRVLQQAAAQ